MNILITGCNGQLGNEMQLLESANPQHTFFNTDVKDLDITDKEAIDAYVDRNDIDLIVNCAAYTAVDKAESNRQLATALNAEAPAYLAAAMARRGGNLVQISTDYVFDGTKHTPYVETDTPCPDSVYGSTKLAERWPCSVHLSESDDYPHSMALFHFFGNNFVKTMIRLGKGEKSLVLSSIR